MGDLLEFVRKSEHQVLEPDPLGLPPGTGRWAPAINEAAIDLRRSLTRGDEDASRRLVFDLFLVGHSLASICDQVIVRAFAQVGELWRCGNSEVFEEHRACEIITRLLFELRYAVRSVGADAPTAIGCTSVGDPYSLPTTMVDLALAESGFTANTLGREIPFTGMIRAARRMRPTLFWLSVSQVVDPKQFAAEFNCLHEALDDQGTLLVVGGRALTPELRSRLKFTTHCDTLQHLHSFVSGLLKLGGTA